MDTGELGTGQDTNGLYQELDGAVEDNFRSHGITLVHDKFSMLNANDNADMFIEKVIVFSPFFAS